MLDGGRCGSVRKVLRDHVIAAGVDDRFRRAMEVLLAAIPAGRAATCGSLARALGDVRAARAVATWITEHAEVEGAGRVVRADGRPVVGSRARWGSGAAGPAHGPWFEDLPPVGLLTELREEQQALSRQVREEDDFQGPETFGGVDVSYEGDRAHAAAVVCDADTLTVLEIAEASSHIDFPYIPTYLAYREFPAVQSVIHRLREPPDVLFVDGHGRLHPTLCGFACFAGVRLRLPSIGVAKHPLVGRPEERRRGEDATPIEYRGGIRGFAWLPPDAARPIYVSVGHRIALRTALDMVRRATRERYPEPLRVADRLTKERKKAKKGKG